MLHATARIRLLKTEEGGRVSCVRSGYRPNIRFGALYTDVALTLWDRQQAYPGDDCEVGVTFVNLDYIREYLVTGASSKLMEGSRKVGEGTCLSIPQTYQKQKVSAGE
jgi:translation elongation factor EF-Tu-like GTPase